MAKPVVQVINSWPTLDVGRLIHTVTIWGRAAAGMLVFQLQPEVMKRGQQKQTVATNQGSKALPRV